MLKLPNAILIKTFRAILQIKDAPYPLRASAEYRLYDFSFFDELT